jgi:hypothetical protein
MSDLSNYAENKLLDHLLGLAAFTMPTPVYLAAFTAVTDAEAGTGTEVTGGSYARVAITSLMSAAVDGNSSNAGVINFPTATANWGTPTHFGIFDAAAAGNALSIIKARNGSPVPITTGMTLSLAVGELDFGISGELSLYARTKLCDHILGKTAYPMPFATLALYRTLLDALTGNGGEIPTGLGYGRKDVTAVMSAASAGASANTAAITFGPATNDWGVTPFYGIRDAFSGGNPLTIIKAFSPSALTVLNGDSVDFAIGDLTVAMQ